MMEVMVMISQNPMENQNLQELQDGPPGVDAGGLIETNCNDVVESFDDMNLEETLLRGI